MSKIPDLIEYYQKLLNMQYIDKPKALNAIAVITELLYDNAIFDDIRKDMYNIESDNDFILNIIGAIVGLYRNNIPVININNSNLITGSYEGDDAIGAYYNDEEVYIISANSIQVDYNLDNATYRQLLKFKIILNNSRGIGLELNESFSNIFGLENIWIIDLLNMNILYLVKSEYYSIFALLKQVGALPKITGVGSFALKNKKYRVFYNENGLHTLGSLSTSYSNEDGNYNGNVAGVSVGEDDILFL